MINFFKESLWRQFGASIDMLNNALLQCPDDYLHSKKKFFYAAYHTIVFLDYYLSIPPKDFSSPLPYTLKSPGEIPADAIDDVVPDRLYSKAELIKYLRHSRDKCKSVIASLTEDDLKRNWIAGEGKMDLNLSGRDALSYPVMEILLYNLRHVQHHTAQMNMMLRQDTGNAPDYVSHAADSLNG
ncbi:DinB family protein [Pollutibacter soli]|uniref:DinB family protein n=1 Tax=Pollutibacter soli TaxID=3034157 RepID=UPI0030134E70